MRFLIILAALAATPAFAHALLEQASPRVGSTIATAPAEITLDFSGTVEAALSRVTVSAEDGRRVDRADLHADPNRADRLVLGLAPLARGSYSVSWHVTSIDGHMTQGRYRFTLGGN